MGKIYLAIAFILAGSSVVAARFISAYIPPYTTTFLSLAIAFVTAVLICGKRMLVALKQLSKYRWKVLILQAIFGSLLFRIFLTIGLQHIGATIAGIITGTSPAITALLAWFMLREHLAGRTVIGILMSFAGVLLVQGFPFEFAGNSFNLFGGLLVFCAAICEALFTTLSRKIHIDTQDDVELTPMVQAGFVSMIAMILCFIPMLMENPWGELRLLPMNGWLGLIWYGSIVTIVAFSCMFAGAKRCNGYTIAAFTGLIPISSTVLAVMILNEPINLYQISGCLLVVLATIIISYQKKTAL